MAAINAWILYEKDTKDDISERDLFLKLAEELPEQSVQDQNNIPAKVKVFNLWAIECGP